MPQLKIRKVAVLGAGVMGAQIAAHLVNARVDTVLFDLAASEGDKNGIVLKAIANLGKLSPAPLAARDRAAGGPTVSRPRLSTPVPPPAPTTRSSGLPSLAK